MIMREYHKKNLYTYKFEDLDEMEQFFIKYKLSQLS